MSGHLDDAEWLRQQIQSANADGEPDNAAPEDDEHDDALDAAAVDDAVVDLDTNTDPAGVMLEDDTDAADEKPSRAARFDRKVAARLGAVAAAGVLAAVTGAIVCYGGGPSSPPTAPRSVADPATSPVTAVTPTATPADDPSADRALAFTAAADCPPGSTSAQTLAGADPMSAFVCVRDGLDGQVIDVDLGKTYVITAISLTPGWIGSDSSGAPQWTQHRVVSKVQYLLCNGADVTLLTQDTRNVHGEAVQPVKRVLAERIRMVVLQTSRPPAQPSAAPTPGAGPLDSVPGSADPPIPTSGAPAPVLGADAATSEPVDATFAISSLKIIGHEAI
ncbi:MAG: hypothetical protein JO191_04465 [Mycobacteriaceae bacterium]|nr:hypothetical protein [Mycobacteriaceae bacterium]